MTMYDAQGGAHTVNVDFLKSTTANTWYVEINAVPASSVTSANGQLAAGTVTFNSDGSFKSTSLVTGQAAGSEAAGAVALSVPFAAASGLGTQAITLNLNNPATGGLTQYAAASATNSDTVDGGPTSPVAGVAVTAAGLVEATFANGSTKTLAQVALATFTNYDGLTATTGDAFQESASSGQYVLSAPQQGTAGTIQASTLESSTVDLSSEFTNLITTQNAYSAASKIISTADQMETVLQQLIPG
jgi:flagellar hook protein FlgE